MANRFAAPGPGSKYRAQGAKPAGFFAGVWHGIIAPVTAIVSVFSSNVSIYETNNRKIRYNLGFILTVVPLYLQIFFMGYDLLAMIALLVVIWQGGNLVARERKLTEMNRKLEEANHALSNSMRELFRVNQELTQKTDALEAANRRIQDATRHKSEFLASMSHELRTPMNAIMGFTRLVHRKGKDILPLLQVQNLEKIMESSNHLMALINDVLDISKIEAGRMEMAHEEFSLHDLIISCVETIRPLVKECVTIQPELGENVDMITSDMTRVRQIITNLLSNAAKFTENGSIDVVLRQAHAGIEVSVSDTGIGIPEDSLEKIFDEFRQVDQTTTRQYGGTGLGLSISRKLARMLGGEVTVDSKLDKGSIFTLSLPLDSTDGPVRSLEVDPTKRLVISIDDDPDVLSLIAQEIEDEGYQVIGVTRAIHGIEKAKELGPIAITLDIMMPGMDGWEAIARLKEDTKTRHIPIVVMSIIDDRQLGYRLGADEYLVKPVDKESLLSALEKVQAAGKQVLVVDDDPVVLDLCRQLLEEDGWTVTSAGNGEIALSMMVSQTPDVILLDLMMPVMDGFTMLYHLRQDESTKDLPVIVLTAKDLTQKEEEELRRNTVQVIEKRGLEKQLFMDELRKSLRKIS